MIVLTSEISDDDLKAIQQGLDDMLNGRTESLATAMQKIRTSLTAEK